MISLAICAFLIPVVSASLGILMRALKQPMQSQDELGIAQLRHVIAVSDEFSCSGDKLSMHHRGEDQILCLTNGNLILRSPGTQIFLTDLSEASFSIKEGVIVLTYAHPGKEYVTRCIGRT